MIDLHTHSSYSDGELAPRELVINAAAAGITVLALTDHDTIDGINEAETQANSSGIQLIPGVELSTNWRETSIHVLGLVLDIHCSVLQCGLLEQQAVRRIRAQKIAACFAKLGMQDICQIIGTYPATQLLSRAHFADALVKQGYVKDYKHAFKHYLGRGKPAYIHAEWASFETVMMWIKEAGGIAVLAHPTRYQLTRTKLRELVADFYRLGGTALEVLTSRTQEDEIQLIGELGREYGLLASVGSDYHGPSTWVKLGCLPKLPVQYKPIWSEWKL
jgi:predicted metal-dependent phosphoesterase TrpH